MDYIRLIISYGILIGALIGLLMAASIMPTCSRAVAPPDYADLYEIPKYSDVTYDATATIRDYQVGDLAVVSYGDGKDKRALFGWVAGVPGDLVGVANGDLTVNGKPFAAIAKDRRTQRGSLGDLDNGLTNTTGIVVPTGHLYIASDRHKLDSTVFGPIPISSVLGRVTKVAPHLE